LANQVDDASERFSAYYGLWAGHLNRSEPALLREMADLFLGEATARPDCPEDLVGHRPSGFTCFYFGDFSSAHVRFAVDSPARGQDSKPPFLLSERQCRRMRDRSHAETND
jgi:hypothetical protein